MQYEEALKYIHSFGRFVNTPGLGRMRTLMSLLKNPQDKLKIIHVAGTNGKGSTVAMTSNILREAGYKVGMYTSPYIFDFRERIQIDFKLIPEVDLAQLVMEVKPTIEKMEAKGEKFAEFEIITALAFVWFEKQVCDFVVLETGLGGRLDATNIIKNPLVTAITSISLDHTKILGNTPEEIAEEKCGIIKNLTPTVVYPLQTVEVMAVIKKHATGKKCPLVVPSLSEVTVGKTDLEGTQIQYKGMALNIPLVGKHQVYNGITAVEIVRALKQVGYVIGEDHIVTGIKKTRWPGRVELIRKNPTVVIDGSHNLSGIEALVEVVKNMHGNTTRIVFGMLQDKDYVAALEKMGTYSDEILLAKPKHPLGVENSVLYSIAKKNGYDVTVFDSVGAAVEVAIGKSNPEDSIIICGSLYIIEEAKKAVDDYFKD
ncbi:MAG: folylpolyglutamate synthase/dihydrofolate synthase family protein [Cellulosilyticaceae bacterium]